MRLTRASQYAIGALVHMAGKPDGISASHDIARAEGIPELFLLKALKTLVSARVLYSAQGAHGGYRLAKRATQVTLLEIIEAVEGPIRGDAGDFLSPGAAQVACDQAAASCRRLLGRISVADLA